MKKSIFILSAVLFALSLMGFGYVNWKNTTAAPEKASFTSPAAYDNEPVTSFCKPPAVDLEYAIGSRFKNTLTKEKAHSATLVVDILPDHSMRSAESFRDIQVSVLYEDAEPFALGDDEALNASQIMLLQSTEYASNILVKGDFKKKHADTDELYSSYFAYYMTIVPEHEAEYAGGQEALIAYLKEGSKEATAIIQKDKPKSGTVAFTVTKRGAIEHVTLNSTPGYELVDKVLVELVENMPKNWTPATNAKGENVDQEFVFFFGEQGC